jgi:hypothetical protein
MLNNRIKYLSESNDYLNSLLNENKKECEKVNKDLRNMLSTIENSNKDWIMNAKRMNS